jgi:peptide deformylase
MLLPKIVQTGNIVLRAQAAAVRPEAIGSREMRDLVSTMVAVMRAAPGVGLAAPQLGVGLRVIVLEDREDLMARLSPEDRGLRHRVPFPLRVIFNPVITVLGDKRATFFEGCLSVSGFMALVERAFEVEVTGLDEKAHPLKWRVSGWPARILQHEVDHIDGSLYIDRMLTRSFCANEEAPYWIGLPVDEVREMLNT